MTRLACALALVFLTVSAALSERPRPLGGAMDALRNGTDGSVGDVPFAGPWDAYVQQPETWHAAQLSVVYPGYPAQDPEESDANHRYRINRYAAHVDGLLPIGAARRRFLQEPHAFILGVPLNASNAAPLMVWPGSHIVVGDTLRAGIGDREADTVDLTEMYHAARRRCFDQITPVPVHMSPGDAVLLHRHLLHGVAPWTPEAMAPPEGRMVAYFRPQFTAGAWIAEDPITA